MWCTEVGAFVLLENASIRIFIFRTLIVCKIILVARLTNPNKLAIVRNAVHLSGAAYDPLETDALDLHRPWPRSPWAVIQKQSTMPELSSVSTYLSLS